VSRIQGIRGVNDILPPETQRWDGLIQVLTQCLSQYAYQEIKLPLIEQTSLFKRTIGDVTDIVEKEMYTFTDLNGDSISLRPEGTASCVRAAIEHGQLRQVQKWWYLGPMFRHEKPQKGRYRQFYQLGVEVFGIEEPSVDIELLLMLSSMWKSLGIENKVKLEINCLGTLEDRNHYKSKLVEYFEQHLEQLSEDERHRLQRNPLRLLDSKSPVIQQLLMNAPHLIDSINSDSRQNFDLLCRGLDAIGIKYQINPFLVRGLDYYNHLVFEWTTTDLGSQGTVCAGGRYDSLVEQLGGPSTPAIGFAMGIERLLLLTEKQFDSTLADIYILTQESQPLVETQLLAHQLRQHLQTNVEVHLSSKSLKSQFKKADKSGAKYALVLGADELQNHQVTVKLLREDYLEDQQLTLNRSELIAWLQNQHGERKC
jgi:histidyl-tRNA synthetase